MYQIIVSVPGDIEFSRDVVSFYLAAMEPPMLLID